MRKLLSRIYGSAAAWAFAGNVMRGGSGVLLLPLMALYVPPHELGLWFVFVSMVGLLRMIDSGMSAAIVRAVAYLWAGAPQLKAFGVHAIPEAANDPNRDGLSDLIRALRVYYRFFALACLAAGILVGLPWVSYVARDLPNAPELRMAWIAFLASQVLILWGELWPSCLTGIDRVREAQQIQTLGSAINLVVSAVGLLMGGRIWALIAGMFAMGAVIRLLAVVRFRRAVALSSRPARTGAGEVLCLLLPTAWRTSVRAMGAFLNFPATVFISSALVGLDVTASYGMALQLLSKLNNMSAIWIQVKMPAFSRLWTQGDRLSLAGIFVQRMRLSLLTYLVGAVLLIATGTPLLNWLGADTVLPGAAVAGLLAVAFFAQLHHSQHSALIMSANNSPFWVAVPCTGAVVLAAGLLLAPSLGLLGVVLPVLAVPLVYINWAIPRYSLRVLGLAPSIFVQGLVGATKVITVSDGRAGDGGS